MTIINLFVNFINKILSLEILGWELINWLLSFSAAIFIFRVIYILINKDKKSKNKKGSE